MRRLKRGLVVALALVSAPALAASDGRDTGDVTGSHEYDVGPLKFSFGPQSDGYFGATLKGDKTYLFSTLSGLAKPGDAKAQPVAWFSYGNVDLALDSGWSSAPAADNNATLSVKPTITFGAVYVNQREFKTRPELPPDTQKLCNRDDADYAAAPDDSGRDKATLQLIADGCNVYRDPYHDIAAISLYPSFEYRFGHFTQGGQQYQANQAVIGAGVRVFFPWQLNRWWASWPFVSATYYKVKDNSGSNIPVPDGIKADYISGEAKADVLLPIRLGNRAKAFELSLDITGSRATSGTDRSWQFMKNFQLLANLGNEWKPAFTYREGKDRGLTYDKQVILGIVSELR